MQRGKLLMISIGLVMAGIFAALPFYHAPQEADSTAMRPSSQPELPLRGSSDTRPSELLTLSLSPSEEQYQTENRSPAAEFLRSAQQREPVLELPQIRRDEALRSVAIIPDLAPSFRPFTETIRLLRDVDRTHTIAMAPNATPPADLLLDSPEPEQPVRRHRIVDGDTLASIAQRYYNNDTQADSLFQANREVLKNPQVLPLGEWLLIPPASDQSNVRSGGILGIPHGVSSADLAGDPPAIQPQLTPVPAQLFESP